MRRHSPAKGSITIAGPTDHKHTCNKGGGSKGRPQLPFSTPPVGKHVWGQIGECTRQYARVKATKQARGEGWRDDNA